MRAGRISTLLTAAVAALLVLGGCTTPDPVGPNPSTSATPVKGGNVTVLENAPFTSFNPESVTGRTATNVRISSATHTGFNRVDTGLKIVKNESFGTYKKVSDRPLVIKYTINKGVQWSDGEPVTAADLLLQWAAASGYFNDSTLDKNFKVINGTAYFHAAGDTSALAATELPVIGDDGASLTLTYNKPFSDWETALGTQVSVPAHIVAQRSGLKDAQALVDLFQTVPKGNPAAPVKANAQLRKVADFWNTGLDTKAMPDPSLALSNGPFLVQSIAPSKELVLTVNQDYTWGFKAKLDTVTVHYGADSSAAVAALTNKSADVISPATDLATYEQLSALKNDGVTVVSGQSLGFDQAVLNFSGVLSKPDFRNAFLKTVPRTEIVQALLTPFDKAATPLNSFVFRPVQTPYNESARSNGSADFKDVDIDGATKLLAGAKPTIRVLYNKDDPVRAQEYALIAASAALAGFSVTDAGKPADAWQGALTSGAFDVALYGWSANATGSDQVPAVFKTGAPSNFNGFSNTVVDQLTEQLATTSDDAKANSLKLQIDRLVFDAGYGLPLFVREGFAAHSQHVTGISYSPVPIGVWWNVWDWSYKK